VILQLESVSKAFGSVKVADKVDLDVAQGTALGIIGPNGAGKTSLFNLIAGSLKPDSGIVRLNGKDVTQTPARARARAGIARTYQIPQPFGSLTVFENLLVAATFCGRHQRSGIADLCRQVLDQTQLLALANRSAGTLTLLERKRLELARALTMAPQLLLLDEIGGGLTEAESKELVSTISAIKASGVTIIWIEHIVHALIAVVDRLLVLNFGRRIAEGEPRAVMASPEVREIYMGIAA
jgi:branched-chain amino acid transport system ATP-binding protein